MTRAYYTFCINNSNYIKQQMLSWGDRFNICCFLDNHYYPSPHHSVECIAGFGSAETFNPGTDFFSSLSEFVSANNDFIFGHFNYDIKNKIEKTLTSNNPDATGFPDCFLFVPQILIILTKNQLTIGVFEADAKQIFDDIIHQTIAEKIAVSAELHQRITKTTYLQIVNEIKGHIQQGDCYELNFCQEFFTSAKIHPASLYAQLIEISPNPFSAFYRICNKYLLCASPERYLKKEGNKLISQPIKGTAARHNIAGIDDYNKTQLKDSAKDKSENVMIVDLVRNDLSKICEEGTVTAQELFAVYSFPNVHQMISTITGVLKNDKDLSDVLKATFPMGSMTGAPKRKVMELIEKFERSKRGIYSGTVGYISPDKDFDFNVVIRSLVYNDTTRYLSFHAGGAITSLSDPEKEYEECLLKGKAIIELLSQKNILL